MIKITRFFYIHWLLLPMLVVSFALGAQMTFFISYSIVLLHELCHLLAAFVCKIRVKSVIVMPFGMTLRLSSSVIRTPKKEVIIALAGPFSNVLMLVLGAFLYRNFPYNANFYLYMIINACVLILNLLPVPPLDGGRVLRVFMVHRFGLSGAAKIMRRISYIVIALLCMTGLYLLILTHGNPGLLIISGFLLYHLAEEQKNSDLLLMRQLLYEKELLKNRTFIPKKHLLVQDHTTAGMLLKKLNLSSFYLFSVLDSHGSLRKTITEQEVISAILAHGYRITAGEISQLR